MVKLPVTKSKKPKYGNWHSQSAMGAVGKRYDFNKERKMVDKKTQHTTDIDYYEYVDDLNRFFLTGRKSGNLKSVESQIKSIHKKLNADGKITLSITKEREYSGLDWQDVVKITFLYKAWEEDHDVYRRLMDKERKDFEDKKTYEILKKRFG